MKRMALAAMSAALFAGGALASECGWCADLSLDGSSRAGTTTRRLEWSRGEAETNRIDLLLAFDAPAREWLAASGFTEEEFSEEAVLEANAGLGLTGLDECFTFRLAGLYDIAADLSEWSLLRLWGYAAGWTKKAALEPHFLPLREFRDAARADVVVVFTVPDDDSYYGATLGLSSDYMSKTGMVKFAECAYCAVDIRSTFTRYTMLHEIGHVFGAGHATDQGASSGPQLRPYSAGYRFAAHDTDYTTVMGYAVRDTAGNIKVERLPFFSSPDWTLYGVPVGTAAKNDNTRTLRETYALVANFRVATPMPGFGEEPGISLDIEDEHGDAIPNGATIGMMQFCEARWSLAADADGAKVTVKVKGLPSGLKYSAKTGLVTGRPKKAGAFRITVKATARGLEAAERAFTLVVSALPQEAIGTYAGIVSNAADGVALATATITKTGRTTVAIKTLAARHTYSASGFALGGDVIAAAPSARIKGKTETLAARIAGRSITLDGWDGAMMQNPWGRKDVAAPVFRKAVVTQYGDLRLSLSGKGRARLSGKIDGTRVSGTFQIVADGSGAWFLPVLIPAKRGFAGWARALPLALYTDEGARVTGASTDL